jgi:hypothetical protein
MILGFIVLLQYQTLKTSQINTLPNVVATLLHVTQRYRNVTVTLP